jgi:hypothetical protein
MPPTRLLGPERRARKIIEPPTATHGHQKQTASRDPAIRLGKARVFTG